MVGLAGERLKAITTADLDIGGLAAVDLLPGVNTNPAALIVAPAVKQTTGIVELASIAALRIVGVVAHIPNGILLIVSKLKVAKDRWLKLEGSGIAFGDQSNRIYLRQPLRILHDDPWCCYCHRRS